MPRYEITHSLLSSWLYALYPNPYEDSTSTRDAMEDFLVSLRREPSTVTPAMQGGLDWEDEIADVANGKPTENPVVQKIADIIQGGVIQYPAKKEIRVNGLDLMLYGRLDCLKGGVIYDIKKTSRYERGCYYDSTQHPMYFELVPEARDFVYLASDGHSFWSESYARWESKSIVPTIRDFIDWLNMTGYIKLFKEKWEWYEGKHH